ncbi:MAG: polyprenol phosphomannose-dependent alpha 1,6 mannosyltransferase MptB [Micrococcaceae bacterium]
MDRVLVDPSAGHKKTSSSVQKNYIFGCVSSILILISSFVLGWVPPEGMWGSQFFLNLRLNYPVVLIAVCMMVLGTIGLLRSWLHIATELRPWQEGSLQAVQKAFYYWATPLIFTLPMFSRDVYAYIAQGRLVNSGYNPYTTGTSAIPGWFYMGADPMWSESRTPYGPLFLFMSNIVYVVSGGHPETAVLLFRAIALAGVVLLFIYIPKVALQNDQNPAKALWVTALCPLFLFHFIVSCHNDALMMGFLVAGIYFMLSDRPIAGLLLLSLSIAIKPITLIAIPFFGLMWAGYRDTWPERIKYWTLSSVIALGPVIIMGFAAGWGIGWVAAFGTPGQATHWYAPVVLTRDFLLNFFGPLGVSPDSLLVVVKNIALLLAACFCAYLVLGANHLGLTQRMFYAFTAVVLSSTVIHPWYMLWLLVLWGITGVEYGTRMILYIWIVAFFLVNAMLDPLDISILLKGHTLITWLVGVLTVIGIYYCVFLDKHMKSFFLQGSYDYATDKPEVIAGLQKVAT